MAQTVCHKFLETSKKYATRLAVMHKRGDHWNELDWSAYRSLVESVAAGLQTLGVRKGDRVAILANTRLEWAATDLAILGLGAITVPIYYNSTPEDLSFILENSKAKILVCESASQFKKLAPLLKPLVNIEKVICFDGAEKTAPTTSTATPHSKISRSKAKSRSNTRRLFTNWRFEKLA